MKVAESAAALGKAADQFKSFQVALAAVADQVALAAWAEVAAQSEATTISDERESGANAAMRERNLGFMDGVGVGKPPE